MDALLEKALEALVRVGPWGVGLLLGIVGWTAVHRVYDGVFSRKDRIVERQEKLIDQQQKRIDQLEAALQQAQGRIDALEREVTGMRATPEKTP